MHLQQDTLIPSCFHCRNTGHFVPNCPLKIWVITIHFGMLLPPVRHSVLNCPSTNQYQQGRQRRQLGSQLANMSSRSTCNRSSQGNFCAKPPCQFPHVCNKCNQGHPGVQCSSASSSFFFPQAC